MADDRSATSQEGLVRQRRSAGSQRSSTGNAADHHYQPGAPIGYLAARGTPYERKYMTRKLGACCLFLAPPIIIISLVIALVPVLYAIGEHALHTSQFHVYSSNITAPSNTSFPLTLSSQVRKVGIFPASIHFREPVDVYWNTPRPDMREVHLGRFNLERVNVANGHGTVNQATFFEIADEEAFGIFSGWLVSKEEFTWRIKSKNIHVEAFSFFPTYKNLAITKDIVIKGINNFGNNVELLDLQLPAADPAGGLQVIATTKLSNPSPFGIQVGTLDLDLYYKGLYLGPVSVHGLNVTSGPNIVTLAGRVLPYADNATALGILGELFTNYINSVPSDVVAVGRSAVQENGNEISWLSAGLKQLNAHVNFVPPEPIDPIKGITIETIDLEYSQDLPFNPTISSQNLLGLFQLPFGFPLNITQLATQLNIVMNGAAIGSATGPFAPSNTKIDVLSQKQTAGEIELVLPPSMLVLPNNTEEAKKQLIEFQNTFVYTDGTGFVTQGAAKALTQTPLGLILLDGIKFNVSTGLKGLMGLTQYPTIINSVDVTGGTGDGIDLDVALAVVNPSNLNLSTGDVTLQLLNHDVVGTTTLPNLHLLPGRNDINATTRFDPNVSPYGIETLNRFISGLDTKLNASGFAGSSSIVSLAPSLAGLRLNITLPALSKPLVQAANLTVLDSTGVTDDIANSIVQLANPFTSSLSISRIATNASAKGIFLANINTGLQFTANGKGTTASPSIPLALNLFPPDIFSVVRAFAVQSGQNPAYIDGLVQLAGITLTPAIDTKSKRSLREDSDGDEDDDKQQFSFIMEQDDEAAHAQMDAISNPGVFYDPPLDQEEDTFDQDAEETVKRAFPLSDTGLGKRANLYTGFNLKDYVGKAFSVATADLSIEADTTIGGYGTTLSFMQPNVPLGTDDTLFKLLPVLAKPIVQTIIDGAVLNIDRVTITEARPTSFTATIQGALTNAGPFDGIVSFPQGLEIFWQGRLLTQTAFPDITLAGDLGATLNVQIEGNIPDVDFFTDFLRTAITDPAFVWDIRGTGITVDAIGISISGASLTKSVQLTGLNGLKGQVIINSFDLPSNDPAGGIHLTAISSINNPAQVGVSLSSFGTSISMGQTEIGPASSMAPFTLQALAVTSVPLAGRIQHQDSESGLADLSTLFTRFVHNQNTDLIVQGVSAGPPDVAWLNNGIKALRVAVVLPSQEFEVIRMISLNSLALYFTLPTAWNPRTDSSNTTANFFLPFGFPVDITQVQGPFIANYGNKDMAVLNIPASPASTDVEARILTLTFQNIPFAVYGNAHSTFSQFAADFVAREQVTFNLHGSATANLNTAAGQVNIKDIAFGLDTNLLGLQGLNAHPARVANLDVYHGYPTYLQINTDTTLFNPSDTTVGAGDVSFGVMFEDHIIGNALINNIVLPPGDVVVPTRIQYMPVGNDNKAAGQHLLENYVQNITSTAIVIGTSQTTPIESLSQALSQIQLRTDIPPLGQLLVRSTFLSVPKNIAQTKGLATVTVTLNNPFTANIFLLRLHALANFQDLTIGTIDQDLAATNNVFFAPGHAVSTSNPIPITIDVRPKALLRFIMAAATTYGVDLGPLPPFFQEVLNLPGEAETQVSPYPDDSPPPCNSGNAFDTLGAIKRLLAPLAVTIPIQSTLKLDDYQTDLDFTQAPVPVGTDDSALNLVGPASAPLIQLIVDQSTLSVSRANATALTNNGFTTALTGSLLTNAPADAYIEFPDGVMVEFQGKDIARLSLPPLCTNVPNGIPDLSITTQLTITDQGAFADFAYYLLTKPSFEWRLHSDTVTVRTLGIKFSRVTLSKTITLDAFNGLPGIVITKFETRGDGDRAINIATDVDIPSPASLGVELGQATFDLIFQSTNIGQAVSHNLFLAYKTTTHASLTGYLRDQNGNSQGLSDLGILFTQYLSGQNSTLTIRGNNVVSPASNGQQVGWLTSAFKRFSTPVTLPGHIYQIIYAITLSDLEIFLQAMNEDFAVPATNQHTVATFSNPLEFSLSVVSLKPSIIIEYNNADTASLNLPTIEAHSGVSTGPDVKQDVNFGFTKQIVRAIDRPSFQSFFAQLTDFESATFGLKGSTDVLAHTVIGNIPIQRIPINVTTSLKGINSFNHQMILSNATVDAPTADYLGTHLTAQLENPSNLTVHTNDVSLPTFYQSSVDIGRAAISKLDLVPGTNSIPVLFELQISPFNSTPVQEVLTLYVSASDEQTRGKANTIPLAVKGIANANPPLSPYGSLQPALAGVSADTALTGIGSLVVNEVRVYLTEEVLGGAVAQTVGGVLGANAEEKPVYLYSYVDFRNDLPSGLAFRQIYTKIFQTGTTTQYATVVNNFNGFGSDGIDGSKAAILPPANSNNNPSKVPVTIRLDNVQLTVPVLQATDLLTSFIDLENIIDLDIFDKDDNSKRFRVPGLKYTQKNVPTSYWFGDGGPDYTGLCITKPDDFSYCLNPPQPVTGPNGVLRLAGQVAKQGGSARQKLIDQLNSLAGGNMTNAVGSLSKQAQSLVCGSKSLVNFADLFGPDVCKSTLTTAISSTVSSISSSISSSVTGTSATPANASGPTSAPGAKNTPAANEGQSKEPAATPPAGSSDDRTAAAGESSQSAD